MKLRTAFAPSLALGVALLLPSAASALTISFTEDPSLTTYLSPSEITAAENAFNYAAQQIAANFSDPIHININLATAGGTSVTGESSANGYLFSYSDVRTALINDNAANPTADGTTSLGNVPSTDPTPAGSNFFVTTAQAKALGLVSDDLNNDGTFIFGAGNTYTFDPNNRAVAGAIDFIGVAEHEITEIMGRTQGLGVNLGGAPAYAAFDLFRYTSTGTRDLTGGSGVYFSIDNGVTDLKAFNAPAGDGSDAQDWASGTNDSFNAFSASGVKNVMSEVDMKTMDVIGYDRVQAVPEPGTAVFLGAIVFAVALKRDRRRARANEA